jgi:hypothetical protein
MSIEAISALRKSIVELEETLMSSLSEETTVEEAGAILLEVNLAKRDLGFVYDTFSNAFASMLKDADLVQLPNGAQIEKKCSYDRKGWQHKELGSAVADKLVQMSVDMDTGEITKTPYQIATEILNYCAPSYWKIKELQKLGINADNYCEVGQLKTSIIVRKGDNQ